MIAYLVMIVCLLFGQSADHVRLANAVDINNTSLALTLNSETFTYLDDHNNCNYQIIVIQFDNGNFDIVFHRNCDRVEYSAYSAYSLPYFSFVEY